MGRSSGPRRSTYITPQRMSSGHPIDMVGKGFNKQVGRLCEICESEVAVGRCRICGRWACRRHLRNGVCSVCRDLMCQVCGVRLSVDSCLICGRLVCRECSVELQPGIRVCRDCYSRIDELIARNPRLAYIRRFARGGVKV